MQFPLAGCDPVGLQDGAIHHLSAGDKRGEGTRGAKVALGTEAGQILNARLIGWRWKKEVARFGGGLSRAP